MRLRAPSKSYIKHWVKQGLAFGYPKCCIMDFCTRTVFPDELEYFRNHHFNGSGFVPCPECAKKPWMEIEAQINANRSPEIGYPFRSQPHPASLITE